MEDKQWEEVKNDEKNDKREGQSLLKVHNVTKQYIQKGGGRTGIEGISFTIQRGEFYGVVGESGAGKSTLGKIIAGIEQQDSGTIQFLGKEIQMVFQNPFSAVNPKMKIEKVIMEPWNIRNWFFQGKKEKSRRNAFHGWIRIIFKESLSIGSVRGTATKGPTC